MQGRHDIWAMHDIWASPKIILNNSAPLNHIRQVETSEILTR